MLGTGVVIAGGVWSLFWHDVIKVELGGVETTNDQALKQIVVCTESLFVESNSRIREAPYVRRCGMSEQPFVFLTECCAAGTS